MTETKKNIIEAAELEAIVKLPDAEQKKKIAEVVKKVNTDVQSLVGETAAAAKAEGAKEAAATAEKSKETPAQPPAHPQEAAATAPTAHEVAAPVAHPPANAPAAAVDESSLPLTRFSGWDAVKTGTTIGGASLLGAAVANGANILPAALQTSPWALGAYTGLQSAVSSIPWVGPLIPALGTIPGAAVLAGAGVLGLTAFGKAANMFICSRNPEHESTGLNPIRNAVYGAKILTWPFWKGWEATKNLGAKVMEKIPDAAVAIARRTAHELRNAAKWGGVTGLGIAALWLMAPVTAPASAIVAGSVVGGLGIGYGGNLLYRVVNRLVMQEPSTLPPSSSNGKKTDQGAATAAPAPDPHAEPHPAPAH